MSSQQQQQHAGEAPASAAAAARARLRWTGQLHERFVLAVAELGGADSKPHPRAFLLLLPPLTSLIMGMADRSALFLGAIAGATPKSVLRAMAVPGLTLYHLKSHLQVRACVRHAAGELSPAADQLLANSVCIGSWFLTVLSSLPLLQKYRQAVSRGGNGGGGGSGSLNDRSSSSERQPADHDGDSAADEPRTIAYDGDSDGDTKEALRDSSRSMVQMQREVQRKLQEQIEVQRHLQLRMEAQGRYLQSVLRRAQQVLADHSLASSPEAATAELSELASAVDIECMSSSSPPRHHRQSAATDSCVTTTSSSEAESKAAGSKRLHTSDCTVEQPVQGKRAFNFLQRHNQADQEEEQEEEYAGAEDGSSSEIDLNR
uniref:MYB-CC type transcription factor LHEQLE-containing domain-containing protein n=1 Tax=Oryza glumipatula TaxID=40148 RepID=A0A0E0AVR5_9ORYZ